MTTAPTPRRVHEPTAHALGTPPTAANDDGPLALQWREAALAADGGRPGTVLSPLRDTALTILTFGLYRCWLRTRLRRHIWASVRIDGRPLAYTGTPRDLLMPALAALGALAVVLLAFLIAKHFAVPRPRLGPTPWRFVVTIPLVYVLGLAAWRARAFLLERTRLGTDQGHLAGNAHAFARLHLLTALAVPLTLGWVIPWRQVLMQRRLVSGTRLGGHVLTFEGDARALLGRFAVAWAGVIVVYLAAVLAVAGAFGPKIVAAWATGTVPALDGAEWLAAGAIALAAGAAMGGVCAWYRIGAWRRLAGMVRLDGRRLSLEVRTRDYLALVAGNTLIRVGSLFLASPAADLRHARFVLSRLRAD